MNFLANGDYNFPFEFWTYFVKHFYMWSFQSGTPNPDGVIRLPGRIFNFLVFALGGNIAVGYFYQITCLIVAFFAFYFFAKHFIGIRDRLVCLIGATFFAVNPIFLGNLSKVGLVLAVAMLPLCFIAIKQAFERSRMSILLLYIVCLNISLLHPYTFFVNLFLSGSYFAFMLWQERAEFIKRLPALIGVGVLAVLMNAYLLLAIVSMGTVSKDVISDNVTPIKADYTALVDISNTGDVLTGLAMSKNIFLDFNFYNGQYENVYFFGSFLLYIVLLLLFVKVEKQLSPARKRLLLISFAGFLVFVALATVMLFNLDALIRMLISLPGGWAFRSPLKWQLYIPLALFTIMVIILAGVKDNRWRSIGIGLLGVSFIAMNGYQLVDVVNRQLTPRHVTYFSKLTKLDLKQKNLLFINSAECTKQVMPYNSNIVTELNQIFTSTDMQVKRAWADSIESVNLATYDYVLTCRRNLSVTLKNDYDFTLQEKFVDGAFELYANKKMQPLATSADSLYAIDDTSSISKVQSFVAHSLKQTLYFVPEENHNLPITAIKDAFAGLSPKDLKNGTATQKIITPKENPKLLVDKTESPLYSHRENGTITLSPHTGKDLTKVQDDSLELPASTSLALAYKDKGFDFKNSIKNPSLEEGLWKQKPDDCFNFDSSPNISMNKSDQASNGKSSLELSSVRHVACSGPEPVTVQPGEHYLLSFDYQSPDGPNAGYYVGFGDNADISNDSRLPEYGEQWHTFTKEITIPANIKKLRLKFYAYPGDAEKTKQTSRFDNVSLVRIPPLMNRFYVASIPSVQLAKPQTIEAVRTDPTQWSIRVQGATKPFYLLTKETYHPKWQLTAGDYKVSDTQHFAVNTTMNGWYIDPAKLCQISKNCQIINGKYNFDLAMIFLPQRWFYVGGVISSVAAVLGSIWYVYERHKGRRGMRRW